MDRAFRDRFALPVLVRDAAADALVAQAEVGVFVANFEIAIIFLFKKANCSIAETTSSLGTTFFP